MTGFAIAAYCVADMVAAIHGPVPVDDAIRLAAHWRQAAERIVAKDPGHEIGRPFVVPVEDGDIQAAEGVAEDACRRGVMGDVHPAPAPEGSRR